MAEQDNTTHFGYKTVAEQEKAGMVRGVFDSVASKYHVMNDLMSFGVHRLWKRFTIELAGVRRGQQVLDPASGPRTTAPGRVERASGLAGFVIMDVEEGRAVEDRQRIAVVIDAPTGARRERRNAGQARRVGAVARLWLRENKNMLGNYA